MYVARRDAGAGLEYNICMLLTRLLYFSAFPLVPVMALQGRIIRRHIPILPEAGGDRVGLVEGEGAPLRLLLLGESTAAGVGAAHQGEAMGGQLAVALQEQTGRSVRWRVVGRTGVTAKVSRQRLLPLVPLEPFDLAVIALGVNDTKNLTTARQWQVDLTQLVCDLRVRIGDVPVVLASVPPMDCFPSLPTPLRQFLGWRAALMDEALKAVVDRTEQATYAGPIVGLTPEMFCRDRFHPGPKGYAKWARGIAARVVQSGCLG